MSMTADRVHPIMRLLDWECSTLETMMGMN